VAIGLANAFCVVLPRRSDSSNFSIDDLHIALEDVTKYVKTLIDMYCRTFHTEFRFLTFSSSPQGELRVRHWKSERFGS